MEGKMKMMRVMMMMVVLIARGSFAHRVHLDVPEEYYKTLPSMVEENGYPTTEHTVTTDDGYIIKIHRMRSPTHSDPEKLPTLLIHGIIGISEDYLRMGPKKSLGYLLADEGYDVWLGNLRGNAYTSHVSLKKSDNAFWDFSFDEHGAYDVPSMIDKVLEVTNSTRLNVVAYSMGVSSYYIACNKHPEMVKKVASLTALAPATMLGPRIKLISRLAIASGLDDYLTRTNTSALLSNRALQVGMAAFLCNANNAYSDSCNKISYILTGEDFPQVVWKNTKLIFMKFQPCSLGQVRHFMQLALTDTFSAYDWGPSVNIVKYKSVTPPVYDLRRNTAPTVIYHGANDLIISPMAAKGLRRAHRSRRRALSKLIPYAKFNHLDFVFARDVDALLNGDILATIPKMVAMN